MQKSTGGIPIATELTMVSRSLPIKSGDKIRTDGPDSGPTCFHSPFLEFLRSRAKNSQINIKIPKLIKKESMLLPQMSMKENKFALNILVIQ